MTAIALTPQQEALARDTAREIGQIFAAARLAYGDNQRAAADLLGAHRSTVSAFERGLQHNLKLGNALKMLSLYGLTLEVVRVPPSYFHRPTCPPRPSPLAHHIGERS